MLGCGDMWGCDMGLGAMCCWDKGDWGTMWGEAGTMFIGDP